MGASPFADGVAQGLVEEGVVDRRPAVEDRPYLPLHSLEGWSQTLHVLSQRIRKDNGRIAYYLSNASEWVQMAVWEYDRQYGSHANGAAPGNMEEK